MMTRAVCLLDDLGALRFRGPDTRSFLQGQLSNDLAALRPGALLRAGLHNPQGRTLALLALAPSGSPEEVLAILPRELLASVASTLKRYVLRAKVQINDVSAEHSIFGITAVEAPNGTTTERAIAGGHILAGYARERGLLLVASGSGEPAATMLTRSDWRALDIAAGLPQVYQSTAAQFVAQMLNLDCIDAISFSKGCYTGQEVIARAHYRGRVKRRMQRFLSDAPLQLAPGDSGQLADGRSFRVVDAVARTDGRCEFLAVAALDGAGAEAERAADAAASSAAASSSRISAQPLALPYALPE
jgi:tRNA-modifying protein YgfZ